MERKLPDEALNSRYSFSLLLVIDYNLPISAIIWGKFPGAPAPLNGLGALLYVKRLNPGSDEDLLPQHISRLPRLLLACLGRSSSENSWLAA